jgi:stage V sporulation protein SpoVS
MQAVDIAAKHTDPNAAAREIASIARQRWHAETQGNGAAFLTFELDDGKIGTGNPYI